MAIRYAFATVDHDSLECQRLMNRGYLMLSVSADGQALLRLDVL